MQRKKGGVRLIVSGGYAVDGFLGEITRPHADIDLQLYGNECDVPALVKELIADLKNKRLSIEDKGRGEYYHSFVVTSDGPRIEIAFIQVAGDPWDISKQVVKSDGSLAGIQEYDTEIGSINRIQFEMQDPVTEAADKIHKREY